MVERQKAQELVGKGWTPLINEFYEFIEVNSFKIEVTKVKQKYGSLDVSYDIPLLNCDGTGITFDIFSDEKKSLMDFVDGKLGEIEDKSLLTCEVCGESGSVVIIEDWIYTRCNKHREKK